MGMRVVSCVTVFVMIQFRKVSVNGTKQTCVVKTSSVTLVDLSNALGC
jgi:hypothetical protein